MPPSFLILNTAADLCTVVVKHQSHVYTHTTSAPRQHATSLLPNIEHALSEAKISLKDIDYFAFIAGPGSFTGLRFAVSCLQALAWVHQKPVIPLCHFQAKALTFFSQALSTPNSPPISPPHLVLVEDARMGDVYFGEYCLKEGALIEIQPVVVKKLADCVLHQKNGTIIVPPLLGRGQEEEQAQFSKGWVVRSDIQITASSTALCSLAVSELQKGNTVPANRVAARYFRHDEAWKPPAG